jgi:hypothetical protein
MTITVVCPKHGEHEYAIESNIPGFQGVWCQICWLESLGQSLPYRRTEIDPEGFQAMDEMALVPDETWKTMDKE